MPNITVPASATGLPSSEWALHNFRLALTVVSVQPDLLEALKTAEQFMAGFEDDESQVGLSAKLAAVRSAIAKAEGRA